MFIKLAITSTIELSEVDTEFVLTQNVNSCKTKLDLNIEYSITLLTRKINYLLVDKAEKHLLNDL